MIDHLYTLEVEEVLRQESQKKSGLVHKFQLRELSLNKERSALQLHIEKYGTGNSLLSFAFELSRISAELQKVQGQLTKLAREISTLSQRRLAVKSIRKCLEECHGSK